jgi:hypothetical protein
VMVLRRTRSGRAFPPPISVIGKGGRPWLSLRAHRCGCRRRSCCSRARRTAGSSCSSTRRPAAVVAAPARGHA